jgi:hypothetical protein
VEEPVGSRNGFGARDAHTPCTVPKHQHGRCAVRPFMEETMRVAKVFRAISQWKWGPVCVLRIPVEVAMG